MLNWIVLSLLLITVAGQGSNDKRGPVIVTHPANIYVTKNGIAELQCKATGSPPLNYKWYHNNKVVEGTKKRYVAPNGNLIFIQVRHKRKKVTDTGTYYCIVYNNYGKVRSNSANVTLGYIRKTFREHPVGQSISLGGQVTLSCIPPRGKPKPKLQWLNGNHVVKSSSRISFENKNQRLIIKNFQKTDEGSYKCSAENVGGRRLSNEASIVIIAPPVFVEKPKDQVVTVGANSEATFTCKADGNPKPKIVWRKKSNNTIMPSKDGKLSLRNLKIIDDGIYTCSAINDQGEISADTRLTVNYPPQFTQVTSDINAREGTTVKLSCLADGQPSPSLLWRDKKTGKFFKPYENVGNFYVDQDDRTVILIISNIKKSDKGTYTCQATNSIAMRESHVKVSIHSKTEYPPQITSNVTTITADINSNQRFVCDVDGNPKPTVYWSKIGMGKSLGPGSLVNDYTNDNNHRYILDITKVQQSDGGIFQCQARNKIKTVTKDFELKVTGNIHLNQAIGVGVPNIPSGVRISDWSHNSVLVRWDRVTSGNVEPLLTYAVGYINIDRRSEEKYASYSISPSRDKFMVINLEPDTYYRFFVRAVNKNGPSPPSLLTDAIKTNEAPSTTAAVPQIIDVEKMKLGISVHPGEAGELVVSWKQFKHRSSIDGYYILWRASGGPHRQETLQNNRARRYIITGLQNSTLYEVKVQVFVNDITSRWSKTSKVKTSTDVIVLKAEVRKNDSDSFKITWQPLWKKKSGKDKVKEYVIWYYSIDNSKEKYQHVIPADTAQYQYTIGGLTSGDYKIWMTAKTKNGYLYSSNKLELPIVVAIVQKQRPEEMSEKIKKFVLQPWFLGLLGGAILLLVLLIALCCFCKRSSSKKDDLPIPLQERNRFEAIRKPSDTLNTESDLAIRSRGRESSDVENLSAPSSRDYRRSCSTNAPTPTSLDFPQISVIPNKLYSSENRFKEEGNSFGRPPRTFGASDFDSPSRYNSARVKNPYSPSPKLSSVSTDSRSDQEKTKYPECTNPSPTRGMYPDDPPSYETAIADKVPNDKRGEVNKKSDDNNKSPVRHFGNASGRQSLRSPGSESSNQGSSIAGRRKGLKPLPRLTIASVNWADMLPPPPSHPPPSSVATRSPPPSPTATSMCSETTYGRSHASSFVPRRSASVVSGDMTSDLEKATADSVLSGKSKGKSENKLPFDLAGITSDIIMQWADSVTNTSGSDNESQCSSPSRVSGISSDGSFLTDTDFANAVKAAAECGGFNIDIDLNMYKDMDPISFQPFAGSLSTYNPENTVDTNSKPSSKSNASKDGHIRGGRGRRPRDNLRSISSPIRETSPLITPTGDQAGSKKTRAQNEMRSNNGEGYVPALTRTSALGKLEPVNRGPVKKKYAVVKNLPQVQSEEEANFPGNYPSHSLSSSTSNASTIRSSTCPPNMLTDDDLDDDTLS